MALDGAEWKRSMLPSAKRRELPRGGLGTSGPPVQNSMQDTDSEPLYMRTGIVLSGSARNLDRSVGR